MTKPAFDKLSKRNQERIWDYLDGFGRTELIETAACYMRPADIKGILTDLDEMEREMAEEEANQPPEWPVPNGQQTG